MGALGERSELARTEYESGWDNVLGRYAGRSRENGLAIASFVLGIVNLVIPFVAIVGASVAFVLGRVGRRRARRGARHGGLATAGIVPSVVALLAWVLIGLTMFAATSGTETERGRVETVPVP